MYGRSVVALSLVFVALAGAMVLFTSSARAQDGARRVEVTVTNLTRGQIISPAVVAVHDGSLAPLFKAGTPASRQLRQVAEDAVNQPLVDLLATSPAVGDVDTLPDGVPPGGSVSVVLDASGPFRFVSLVGMLVTTNDAFFGVNGARIPGRGAGVVDSVAYDAGTEENNELCAYIPGPPCGQPLMMAENGEGFVHVHAGVHGIGDLDPAQHDWRNPVARVTIRRLP